MNRLLPYLMFALVALGFATLANAALYNITGTDFFVNGMPANLSVKERAKLVSTTIAKTDAAISAGKYQPITTVAAKAKIKEILIAEIKPVTLMPFVDLTKAVKPAVGFSDLRIRSAMFTGDNPPVGDGNGQFRIDCAVSHMSNDDPILYPNQQAAAHHHTFFGNTSVNYKSNLMTLASNGNSTCRGGIANRSAYWVPSVIDTATNTPLVPYSALWYYKTGYVVPKEKITTPPKGLRIIAGNMKAKSASESPHTSFDCFKEGTINPPKATKHIPVCEAGRTVVTHISFPQCWDGKNLDSPNHQDHMAYTIQGGCPATHPVAIPHITLNVKYLITSTEGTKNWRMSSDNYAVNGNNAGYSSHADWVNGWDEKVIAGIVKNCLNSGKDCGNHMLGDGTVIYGNNTNPDRP